LIDAYRLYYRCRTKLMANGRLALSFWFIPAYGLYGGGMPFPLAIDGAFCEPNSLLHKR